VNRTVLMLLLHRLPVPVAETHTCCAKGSASVEVIEQFCVAVAPTPSCCAKRSSSVSTAQATLVSCSVVLLERTNMNRIRLFYLDLK